MMKMSRGSFSPRKFGVSVCVAGVVLLATTWSASSAVADSTTPIDAVANAAPADVAAAVDTRFLGGGSDSVTLEQVRVAVSPSAANGVTVAAGEGATTIGLPFSNEADRGVSTQPGTVTYDNGNATSSVVLVHDTGAVQVATVIDNAGAPTRFDYPLELPSASSLVLRGAGAAVVDDASGEVLGAFAAPWAKDANGKDVPTRYLVEGDTLTQIVDHSSDFAYPVVADPTYTTSVIWISHAQVVNMYNGFKGISNVCTVLPIPYPASIACSGLLPPAQIEKAYWNGWRIKVTYYNCGFNYCSYTTYTAAP